MKTITLENGKKVAISEESYKALEDAVREVTWEDLWEWANDEGDVDIYRTVTFGNNHKEKEIAISRLLITAKYLNGDWKPDWVDINQKKWFVSFSDYSPKFTARYCSIENTSFVYFKSEEAALRAISILGEDTIQNAFNTDW